MLHTYTGSGHFIKDLVDERDKNFFSLTSDNDKRLTSNFGKEDNDKSYTNLNPDEEDFLQAMLRQYKRDIGGHFISDGRIDAFARQVIP